MRRMFPPLVLLLSVYAASVSALLGPIFGSPGPTAYKINAPASMPTSGDVSVPLDGSFLSFSIEAAFYDYFFGQKGAINSFTFSLVNQLSQRMGGVSPVIRPGGYTMDLAAYDGNSKNMITRVTSPSGQLYKVVYGPDYYKTFRNNFPPNWKFILTLNLKNNSLPATIRAATAAVKLAGDRIQYFELGNEPNLYPFTHNVTDAGAYVTKWLNWTAAIDAAIDKNAPPGTKWPKRRWMVASNTARFVKPALDPVDLIGAGIDKNGQVGQYAIHAYSRSRCTPANEQNATIPGLLDMDFLRRFSKSRISTSKRALASGTGGPARWVLGEGNSISCGGRPGVSDSMAQTMHIIGWGLSYAAYGASQVFLHGGGTMVRRNTDNSASTDPKVALTPSYASYSFAYPTTTPARGAQRAQPGFVGQLLLAEAIGSGGQSQIVLLDTPPGVDPRYFFGAAVYDPSVGGPGPARLVLMNTTPFFKQNGNRRGSLLLDWSSIVYANDGGCPAKRLTGPSIDTTDTARITWAGQNFRGAAPQGAQVIERAVASQITLQDSEAAIVYLSGSPY